MSVSFYKTVWAFAKNPEDLDKITNEQLVEIAIAPGHSPDEGQAWLTEARRERAGKIISKGLFKLKMHASGSNGQCLHTDRLALLHPDVLFVEISGADCSDEERFVAIQNGMMFFNYRGVIPYTRFNDHEFFKLLRSDGRDCNMLDKVNEASFDLVQKLLDDEAEDAIRQDDHEDFDA